MENRLIIHEEDPGLVEWELSAELLTCEVDRKTILSDRFAIKPPFGAKSYEAQLKVSASSQGSISFYMQMPLGVKAEWYQWIGPASPVIRRSSDHWDKVDRFWGKREIGSLKTHAKDGIIRVGVSLKQVNLKKGDLPKLPAQYTLGATLGGGAFGQIREVIDKNDPDANLVAKVSLKAGLESQREVLTMQLAAGSPGIPRCVGHYQDGESEVVILQRLHRDLESLRKDPEIGPRDCLSASTVMQIGVQAIDRLERLHSFGLVHRDLKPDNVMIGSERGRDLYLIDFGLCKFYSVNGINLPCPAQTNNLVGTARYCSVHAHCGLQSRRADMESLGLVLVYLATGSLPWQGIQCQEKVEKYDRMLKEKLNPDVLRKHVQSLSDPLFAEALTKMVLSSRSLGFDEAPNYAMLKENLSNSMLMIPRPLNKIESSVPGVMHDDKSGIKFDWEEEAGRLSAAAKRQRALGQANPMRETTALATAGFRDTSASARTDISSKAGSRAGPP
jgi:serine/threonine protein kinase